MTKRASTRKHGNRYTGANMTAREAQTLAGALRKITVVRKAMEKRQVFQFTVDQLKMAEQRIVNSIMKADRLDELKPFHLDL
jgi:hypothetical protein